ncbi:hypothetical protein [Poseidonibacter sp.]|uniref:hypothetical protein n=1 Tax=Poseidonibacter sp. TaxID=2321188 RepID=UPI003C743549
MIQVYKKTIQECLKSEKENDILSIIIKLYCKLDSEDITNKIVPYLTNENELIKKATIFALIKYGINENITLAKDELTKLFSYSNKDIKIALDCLCQIKEVFNYEENIIQALNSLDTNIKISAIKTVGELKLTKFLPNLLNDLKYQINQIIF